ncbi:MAG: undecaprenyl-diphosphate phosphatase [Fimbriimonadaceae bacterium]|nr:undecaprenyl-diphosphate phosphatase [Fimbriimonadaceae bacterium]
MGIVEAVLIGIVQGLTEFLPISSTAHVRIVPALFGWADPGAAFTAVIQLGTLLAVLIFFWKDLARILVAWLRGLAGGAAAKEQDAKLGWGIFIGTLPIVVLGLMFKNRIENEWRSLQIIAWTLIGLGLLMALAEKVGARKRGMERVTVWDGLLIGFWQALALVPGASRSGSTITGGLFSGLDRSTAARFSFLLSVPSILAAAVLALKEHKDVLLGPERTPVLVATLAAFVSGYWAIGFLLKFLQRHSVYAFTVYRVALGLLLLGLLQSGRLSPMTGISDVPKTKKETARLERSPAAPGHPGRSHLLSS